MKPVWEWGKVVAFALLSMFIWTVVLVDGVATKTLLPAIFTSIIFLLSIVELYLKRKTATSRETKVQPQE